MEIETPAPKKKTQKRILDKSRDTNMEEDSSNKRAKLTEEEVEEYFEISLTERKLD